MSTVHEETNVTLGLLGEIAETLRRLLELQLRSDEYGVADDAERIRFPVANTPVDYSARGVFKSILIINDNTFPVFVGFSPGQGRTAGSALFTLGAQRFVVLPIRGTTLSIGAGTPGSVAIVPLAVTMPAAGGAIG